VQLGVEANQTARTTRPHIDKPTRLGPVEPLCWMPGQCHWNALLLSLYLSTPSQWQFSEEKGVFYLRTPHGVVTANDTPTLDDLSRLLAQTGLQGLQILCAAIDVFAEVMIERHGSLPDAAQVTPITIRVSDLLRAIGRRAQGRRGGYSTSEISRVRSIMAAAARFDFVEVLGTGSKPRTPAGTLIYVLNNASVLDDCADVKASRQPQLLTYVLGAGLWEFVRSGARWLPRELLSMHPVNDKYAIAAGFYTCSLLFVRRNKKDQRHVTLGIIERNARLESFDANERRRLRKLQSALHKLVRRGIIGGIRGDDGRLYAVIEAGSVSSRQRLREIRKTRLRLAPPDRACALPCWSDFPAVLDLQHCLDGCQLSSIQALMYQLPNRRLRMYSPPMEGIDESCTTLN